MNFTNLQELAVAYALGAIEPRDAAMLEQVAAGNPSVRAELAAMLETTAALAATQSARVAPGPAVRSRILDRIRSTPQMRPATPDAAPDAALETSGFHFKPADSGDWRKGPGKGLRYRVLSVSKDLGYWMLLLELTPGGVIPTHDHQGSEQVYLLSGDLRTQGRTLVPGDFLHSEPGTVHQELVSPSGCMAILVEKAPERVLASA
jgi:anti-sigma factor ChrR (cupin superfamily)